MYITIIFNCKNIEEKKSDLTYHLFLLDRKKKKLHLWKLEILSK